MQSADWLVVDHYGLDATWQSQTYTLKSDDPCRLLVIDDLADRPHQADLLDQNSFGLKTISVTSSLCLPIAVSCGAALRIIGTEYARSFNR